jgi:hypothetical protein
MNDRLSEGFEATAADFNLAVDFSAPRFEGVDRVSVASLVHALKHGRRGLHFLWRLRHNTARFLNFRHSMRSPPLSAGGLNAPQTPS